jgi:hypothetical protein
MSEITQSWEERARELHEEGGVPERRADAVAAIEAGMTYAEAMEAAGMSSRGEVSTHIDKYLEETKPGADWLAENGPAEDDIRSRSD